MSKFVCMFAQQASALCVAVLAKHIENVLRRGMIHQEDTHTHTHAHTVERTTDNCVCVCVCVCFDRSEAM
ncbi:MAG: hypothetical protein ACK41O_26335, partial [Runella zeae]